MTDTQEEVLEAEIIETESTIVEDEKAPKSLDDLGIKLDDKKLKKYIRKGINLIKQPKIYKGIDDNYFQYVARFKMGKELTYGICLNLSALNDGDEKGAELFNMYFSEMIEQENVQLNDYDGKYMSVPKDTIYEYAKYIFKDNMKQVMTK